MNTSDSTNPAPLVDDGFAGLDRFLPLEGNGAGYGAAVHMGVRNIICRLYDLQTGELVTHTSASGNYDSFSGTELKELLTDVFETLAKSASIAFSKVKVAVVNGSTAMESRAAAMAPEQLVHDKDAGCENFGCDVEYMLAGATAIAVGQAFFVPCLGPELGGDFLCSLLSVDILSSEGPTLYISTGTGDDAPVSLAYGAGDEVSVAVVPVEADLGESVESLLDQRGAKVEQLARVFVAGDASVAIPDGLADQLKRLVNPAIVGASAVLLSEEAEDELCNIVGSCRVVSL